MSSKRPSPFQEEADRIIREKKRPRNKVACYPCNKRKVKCDTLQPCATCVKRNHPTICTYPSERTEEAAHPARRAIASTLQQQSIPDFEEAREAPFLGSESTTTYMQRLATKTGNEVAQEVSPALALDTASDWNPFQYFNGRDGRSDELQSLLPGRESTQKYYQVYRSTVHPLTPLVDLEPLELKIANYLEGSNAITVDARSVATVALILAILASGAQYSDLSSPERRHTSRDLASKSFFALHAANYLVRPTALCLQTLLLLGAFIRNDGDANASWAFLGTTMRLAQSVGLHDTSNLHHLSVRDRSMRSQLWQMILQHDSILSLCFDRPTSLPTLPLSSFSSSPMGDVLGYQQLMWSIAWCAGKLMHRPREIDLSGVRHSLREVDSLTAQTLPHLREKSECSSMQDRLEFYTVNLHMAFMVSVICRPVFFISDQRPDEDRVSLYNRGRTALANTVRHFLSLHRLTTYAVRTWTTLHEALSSALLLELLPQADNTAEVRTLQKEFLEVVIPTLDGATGTETGLSLPHTRAIAALRKIAQKQVTSSTSAVVQGRSSGSLQEVNAEGDEATLPDGIPPDFDQGLWDSFDSILWGSDAGPAFDDQFWMGLNDEFSHY